MFAREADDERQNVPRDPADHERTEDDGDGAQSFASPVVVARQLLQSLPLRISHHTHTLLCHLSPVFQQERINR